MVAIDQRAARLANGGGAEPGAGPVCGAEVVRNAGNADRSAPVPALDAENARPHGKCRDRAHAPYIGDNAPTYTEAGPAQR